MAGSSHYIPAMFTWGGLLCLGWFMLKRLFQNDTQQEIDRHPEAATEDPSETASSSEVGNVRGEEGATISDRINTMASSSNSCPTIFLSHSGHQKPFTQHLNHELRRANQSCFFDRDTTDSLHKGDKLNDRILQCIRGCKLGVVVLSEEFVTSFWPMAELENLISAGKRIYPIFYGLRPTGLVKDTNLQRWVAEWKNIQFVEQNKEVPSLPFDIRNWKTCLATIRFIAGSEFNPSSNEMYDFIDRTVVPEICKICPPHALYFADETTIKGAKSMAEKIAEAFQKLSHETAHEHGDVEQRSIVLGVHGIGGSGKSTLCKTMVDYYNKAGYSGMSHFMELPSDEAQSTTALVSCLKDMLKHLTQARQEILDKINDVHQAISTLQERVNGRSFFLAIDNVWEWSEDHVKRILKVVLPQKGVIKVMITSRKQDLLQRLLRRCNIAELHKCILDVPSMSENEAWDLIVQDIDKEKLNAIQEEKLKFIRDACSLNRSYHPLLLYIIGKKLGREEDINEKVIEECTQLLQGQSTSGAPDENEKNVLGCLKSIYDSLSRNLKNIFINTVMLSKVPLSIRRSNLYTLFTLLRIVNGVENESEFENKMKELEQYGLLKVIYHSFDDLESDFFTRDKYIEVEVHDFFVDVAQTKALEMGNHWICGSLEPKTTTHVTTVFIYDLNGFDADYKFKSIMQSRVDQLEVVLILDQQPIKLQRTIHLSVSEYVGKNLHTLWLSCEHIFKVTGLNASPNLMYLYLEDCQKLQEITDIGCLHKLQELSVNVDILSGTPELLAVPDLRHCSGLRRLKFGSGQLTDLATLKCPTTLEVLELYGGYLYYQRLDHSVNLQHLDHLVSLQTLSLKRYGRLEEFHRVVLPKLKHLEIQNCEIEEFQPQLKIFEAKDRSQLQLLMPSDEENFPKLEFLLFHYAGCKKFYGLSVLSLSEVKMKFKDVYELDVGLTKEGAEDLSKAFITSSLLQKLKRLKIRLEEKEKEIKFIFRNLSSLVNLSHLLLSAWTAGSGCGFACEDLNPLACLTNLKSLSLDNFPHVERLPDLSHLTGLSELELAGFYALKSIEKLPDLHELSIRSCSSLETINHLSSLTNLRKLGLSFCPSLKSLDCPSASKLWRLEISYCKSLEIINHLSSLTNLRGLDLRSCVSLKSINHLSSLTNLYVLNLSSCVSLETINHLSSLTNLRGLDLSCCKSLVVREDQLICLTNLKELYTDDSQHLLKDIDVTHLKSVVPELCVNQGFLTFVDFYSF